MNSRRKFIKLGAGAFAAASVPGLIEQVVAAGVSPIKAKQTGTAVIVTAYEWPHQSRYGTALKGYEESLAIDPQIGSKPPSLNDLGSTLSLIVANRGNELLSLDKVFFDGVDTAQLFDAPPYQVIWNRLLPSTLTANMEGEFTISLRKRLVKPTRVEVRFTNGSSIATVIQPGSARLRVGTVGFSHDLSTCHVYIERVDAKAPFPQSVHLNGMALKNGVRWLHTKFVANCAVAIIKFPKPLKTGEYCSLRFGSGKVSCSTTIRAFSDLSRFGQYGYDEFEDMANNDLDLFNSFAAISKTRLDVAEQHNIKVSMVIHDEVPKETIGHPAIYSYLAMDEVDVADYSAAQSRPEQFRIGKLAPEMTKWQEKVIAVDPITPTMTTVDLTYKPHNYFIYGPMQDIVNGDCYPIAIGWQVRAVREHMRLLKAAAGARPFLFTYQGHFERWGKDPAWQSRAAVLEHGADSLVDNTKKRGFNRKPDPGEVRQEMLYAIGCGARGLFNYTGATEGGVFVNLGGIDLPDIWKTIGNQSRSLRLVSPLLEIAHPVEWAQVADSQIWISTLICGEDTALVAVVNETAKSDSDGFTLTAKSNIRLSFRDLPWLKANYLAAIKDGQAIALSVQREKDSLYWDEPLLQDCALYLVSTNEKRAAQLQHQLQNELAKVAKT